MEPKQLLRALGVSESDIARGEGTIPIRRTSRKAKVLHIESQDIPHLNIHDPLSIIMDIAGPTAIPFLQKTCTKYRDPEILYNLQPVKMVNVKFHVVSLYLEGDIENKLSNKGKEGEKGVTTRWFFESCPDEEDEYDWETISGSADLESAFEHEIVESKTDEVLDKITDKITAKMNEAISVEAHWKTPERQYTTKALTDLIFTIVKLFMTGGVTTENGYDVTVTYEFRGSKSQSKHIDMKIWIPVEGRIGWALD